MHIRKLKNTGRKKKYLKMKLWVQREELRSDDVIQTLFLQPLTTWSADSFRDMCAYLKFMFTY